MKTEQGRVMVVVHNPSNHCKKICIPSHLKLMETKLRFRQEMLYNKSSACRSIIRPKDEPFDKLVVKTLLEFNLCIHMFIYWLWPIFLLSTMTVTHKLFKNQNIERTRFLHKTTVTLTFDLKMYRGHLLSMINLSTKYQDCHSETFQDIERTWFLH